MSTAGGGGGGGALIPPEESQENREATEKGWNVLRVSRDEGKGMGAGPRVGGWVQG